MTACTAKNAWIESTKVGSSHRFLDLPIEIRLQIYSFLTPKEVLIDIPKQKRLSGAKTSPLKALYVLSLGYSYFDACLFDPSSQTCTALRYTCRQVYHEITSILEQIQIVKLEIRSTQNVQAILKRIFSNSEDSISRIKTVEIGFECVEDQSRLPTYMDFWAGRWIGMRWFIAHYSIKLIFERDVESQLGELSEFNPGWHTDLPETHLIEEARELRMRCLAAWESFEHGKLKGNKRGYLERLVRILSSRQHGHSQELYQYHPPPKLYSCIVGQGVLYDGRQFTVKSVGSSLELQVLIESSERD